MLIELFERDRFARDRADILPCVRSARRELNREMTRAIPRDPPPFCFSSSRALSVSSGLLRIKQATRSKSKRGQSNGLDHK